jgi:hypothetical protein
MFLSFFHITSILPLSLATAPYPFSRHRPVPFLSPPPRTLSLATAPYPFSRPFSHIHSPLFLTPFLSFNLFFIFLPGTRFATGRPSLASSSSSSTLWTPAPRATRESYCRCVRTPWHTPTHHPTVARHGTHPHTTRRASSPDA